MKAVSQTADQLLKTLSDDTAILRQIEARAEAEMEAIRRRVAADVTALRERIKGDEKSLVTLMKDRQAELFDGTDKVELPHGLLLYARGPQVSIPRDALGKIKDQMWLDAIRVVESVDRVVVSAWPDEKLAVIGAKRSMKETFSYELKSELQG